MSPSRRSRALSCALLGGLAWTLLRAPGPVPPPQMTGEGTTETEIRISALNTLRTQVEALFKGAPYLPATGLHKVVDEGGFSGTWGRSPRDPMRLLPIFRRIRLQQGWRLVAYQWLDGGGGYVRVYGLPEGAPFPDPAACMTRERRPATEDHPEYDDDFPLPPRATQDLGALVEVDGTPESYAEKALFLQEVKEFGAYWHGIGWSDCRLVDSLEALVDEIQRTRGIPKDEREREEQCLRSRLELHTRWKWSEPRTRDLRAWVRQGPGTTEVVWHTYSQRGIEQLDRWTFTFQRGSPETPEPKLETVAQGIRMILY